MTQRILSIACLFVVFALLMARAPTVSPVSMAQDQSTVSDAQFNAVGRPSTATSQDGADFVVDPLAVRTDLDEPFGYGLSTAWANGSEAYDLGFNWVKVFDVPAGPQPTKVLYRVQVNAYSWYSLDVFYKQMRQLALSHGPYIDAYEIGNEVNTYDEWGQAPNAVRYVDLLCTARYAIRPVDPTAQVISAGLAPVGRIADEWNGHAGHDGSVQDEREYLKEFLDYNGQLCADGIGYHPMGFRADYAAEPDVDGGTPETDCSDGFCFRGAEKIHEILEGRGLGDHKIWATEVGWIVEPPDDCLGHPSWAGRYWQIVSEEKQAENLVGAFMYARVHWPWLQALFVFNLDFVTAPWYHECEQMRYYSVHGRPAAGALDAMSQSILSTYLPLVLRAQ